MNPFDSMDAAFAPLAEPVEWRQDKAPHRRAAFGAIVLHGSPDSTAAGNPLGALVADPWVVSVSRGTAVVADVSVGDTFRQIAPDSPLLTVQQISRDATGWTFTCSANERSQS